MFRFREPKYIYTLLPLLAAKESGYKFVQSSVIEVLDVLVGKMMTFVSKYWTANNQKSKAPKSYV